MQIQNFIGFWALICPRRSPEYQLNYPRNKVISMDFWSFLHCADHGNSMRVENMKIWGRIDKIRKSIFKTTCKDEFNIVSN